MASLDGNFLGALRSLAAVAGCCSLSEALPRVAATSIHHHARRPPICMADGGKCHCGCGCASERHLTPRASGVWLAAVAGVEHNDLTPLELSATRSMDEPDGPV